MTPSLIIRSFTNDQYILDKVFYANFYQLKAFQNPDKKPIILDIGAHCGYFSFAAISLGAKKVYAFEPFIENYRILLNNVGNREMRPVYSYQMGIYVADVALNFGYPQLINGSFFDFGNVGAETNITSDQSSICPCISLDNALKVYVPEIVDLLKISIGYAEMQILAGSTLLNERVNNICGEASLDETNQMKFKGLMAGKGFIHSAFYPVQGEDGKVMFQFSKTSLSEMFLTK
jgi:FkbM family methyltransferase